MQPSQRVPLRLDSDAIDLLYAAIKNISEYESPTRSLEVEAVHARQTATHALREFERLIEHKAG